MACGISFYSSTDKQENYACKTEDLQCQNEVKKSFLNLWPNICFTLKSFFQYRAMKIVQEV